MKKSTHLLVYINEKENEFKDTKAISGLIEKKARDDFNLISKRRLRAFVVIDFQYPWQRMKHERKVCMKRNLFRIIVMTCMFCAFIISASASVDHSLTYDLSVNGAAKL